MIYLIKSAGYSDIEGKYVDLLKIGYTKDNCSESRLVSYKLHNPTFKLLYSIPGCDDIIERKIQRYFSEYRYPGYGNEWFVWSKEIIDFFEGHTSEDSILNFEFDSISEAELDKFRSEVITIINFVVDFKVKSGDITIEQSHGQVKNLVDHIINTLHYRSMSKVWRHITENLGIDKDDLCKSIDFRNEIIDRFMKEYNTKTTFPAKMKFLCNFEFSDNLDLVNQILPRLDEKIRSYVLALGKEKIKALGYHKTKIEKELGIRLFSESDLGNYIRNTFKPGEKYTLSDLKTKLGELYGSIGYQATPKANDILEYFEVKEVVSYERLSDGKRKQIRGYELLSYKQ